MPAFALLSSVGNTGFSSLAGTFMAKIYPHDFTMTHLK